jgi:putative ABC transport system substrate-binding protein
LAEQGYVEGQNIVVEYRVVGSQYDRFPALAAELTRLPVALLITTGGVQPARAALAATSSIPIVFMVGSDPVEAGLVANYNRPGGNATGLNMLTNTLEAKRLGLLHDLVPQATSIGMLVNPRFQESSRQLHDLQEAGRSIGLRMHGLQASTDAEIDKVFDDVVHNQIAAMTVAAEPFFNTRRDKLVALAARYRIPTMYQFPEYAVAGGLVSYGIDLADAYRQVAAYAGRILKGEKPADLPVAQPTKFELVLNMKTAKEFGLSISTAMQMLADKIIE